VNPKVFSPQEWKARASSGDTFVASALSRPKIFLIGNEHDLARLGQHRLEQITPSKEVIQRLLAAATR